jgi:alpha-L-fucosidase 2
MPAVPDAWKDVSFDHLRAEGAYLVSAKKVKGIIQSVTVFAEKGGTVTLKMPFKNWAKTTSGNVRIIKTAGDFVTVKFDPGATLDLISK